MLALPRVGARRGCPAGARSGRRWVGLDDLRGVFQPGRRSGSASAAVAGADGGGGRRWCRSTWALAASDGTSEPAGPDSSRRDGLSASLTLRGAQPPVELSRAVPNLPARPIFLSVPQYPILTRAIQHLPSRSPSASKLPADSSGLILIRWQILSRFSSSILEWFGAVCVNFGALVKARISACSVS